MSMNNRKVAPGQEHMTYAPGLGHTVDRFQTWVLTGRQKEWAVKRALVSCAMRDAE